MAVLTAAIGGLVAASPLVDAESPAPDRSPHVLVVPSDAQGATALARSDVRTIARYEDFTLVEASGADEAALRASGADRRDDMRHVRLAGEALDPARRESLAAKGADPDREELVLVQFVGPVKDAWVERLRATGGRVIGYVAQNGYLVHAVGDDAERLAALVGTDPAVRAVTPVRPGDKVEGLGSAGLAAVQTVAGALGADARAAVEGAGEEVRATSTVRGVATQYVRLGSAEAAVLAEDPAVLLIEPYALPEPLDERSSQIAAGNLTGGAPSGPGYLGWLADKGFTGATFDFSIDVTDAGFDNGSAAAPAHPDFYVGGVKPGTDRVDYVKDYTLDATPESDAPFPPVFDKAGHDCGGHGTNVASIAAGHNGFGGAANEDGAGFNHGVGVAPFAKLGASKIFRCDQSDPNGDPDFVGVFPDVAQDVYRAGARISNNSWGTNTPGAYNADARDFDAMVRDAAEDDAGNQQLVEVVAAGNEGNRGYASISSPGTAKNVITVGASEGVRPGFTDGCGNVSAEADNAGDVLDFSSRGPTDDLRMKPDLVAPGTHVTGARPTHLGYITNPRQICDPIFPAGTTYNLVSGTSQAAPVVAGAAALIRDWYERGPGDGDVPSPALTKAILIDSATDLAGGDDGKSDDALSPAPSVDAGWGRLNLGKAFDATARSYIEQGVPLTTTGTSVFRSYTVPAAGSPVRVTLVWTDAPPAAALGNAFVNDLDLTVSAGGRTYLGNVIEGGVSTPGGAPDHRNNVESVILPAGAAERISVEVGATTLGGDGVPGVGDTTDQDFALVVSNANETSAPVLSAGPTTVNDGALGGDGDSILESAEEAELVTSVRNSGTDPATAVTGTLASGGDLAVDDPGPAAFNDIAPDSSETPAPPFDVTYPAAAACGADAVGTLTMGTGTGDQTVPVIVPTGAPGAALASNAAAPEVPKPIPDDGPGWVSSSLFLGARGRVKDLDVRIAGITHEWVGDLVITLTGPDGTTVTLARHPGGPNNGANHFQNVVFNDEAPGQIPAGSSPVQGSFKPQGDQLSRFDGKARRGTWTLRVRDLFDGDPGTLVSWGLTTRRAVCNVDTTAPTVTLPVFPGSPVNETAATFGFDTPDTDSGFECSLDGAVYAPCTSTKTYTGLVDGPHTFKVQAIDGSGNESAEKAHMWTVDTVPPDTSATSGPTGFVSGSAASFEFSSSEPGVTDFECELDGGGFSPCASPQAYPPQPDGPHSFRVRAIDLAGNTDPTPAVRSFTVDTVAPAPQVTRPVTPTQDRTPLITGTGAHDAGDTANVTVELLGPKNESHAVTIDGNGNWAVQAGPLPLGSYTVKASQTDQAGNSGFGTRAFTLVDDDVAPGVTLRAPAMGSSTPDTTPRLSGVAGTADGDEPTVALKLYAGALPAGTPAQTLVAPVSPTDGAFAIDSAPLAAGTWTVVAEQLDSAGNTGASFPTTFTVAAGPPPPPPRVAPSLIVVRGEEDLGTAIKGGLPVLAACGTDCSARASLSVSGRTAKRLGLRAPGNKGSATQAVELGRASAGLAGGERARLPVRLTRQAKTALKKPSGGTTVKLLVTITEESGRQTRLNRSVVLHTAGRLQQVVRRGYPVLAACSERCALSGRLSVSRREAARLKLRRPRGDVTIAAGRTTGGTTARRLTLRVPKVARKALSRASRVSARLSMSARNDSGAEQELRLSTRLSAR